MLGRESTAAKLKAARETLATRRASLATSRKILDAVDADLDEVAARTHGGELDELQAEKELADVAERERVHTAAVDHLERTCALLEDEIAALEADERSEVYAEALKALEASDAMVHSVSGEFGSGARTQLGRGRKLAATRSRRDELLEEALALRPDGAPYPPRVDEPVWLDDVERNELLDLLKAGPRTPIADGEAQAVKAKRAQDRQDSEHVRSAVNAILGTGSLGMEAELRLVPERLHDRVRAEVHKRSDARRAQLREEGAVILRDGKKVPV